MEFYSFYKITIKGTKHCYIGSTKDINGRMRQHKNACTNPNHINHYLKIYTIIREHGGWDNVEHNLIETKQLETKEDALLQEQRYIVQHKATLNSADATVYSLKTLIEMKDMTQNNTYENKKKRCRLATAIWKRGKGKEKYNEWQRNYMRGRQQYVREVRKLFQCLAPEQPTVAL